VLTVLTKQGRDAQGDLRFLGLAAGIVIVTATSIYPGVPLSPTQGHAFAASVSDKAQGRTDLEQILKSLQAVGVAYSAGNTAEAQAHYGGALLAGNVLLP